MPSNATVRFPLNSEKQSVALMNALLPEARTQIGVRAIATLEKDDSSLILNVKATDTIALRASLNAYLRWIDSTIKVLEVMSEN
jgi:KEOPS complex subunit Pcc1